METGCELNFPKMEKHFEVEWQFLQQQLQSSLQVPFLPTIQPEPYFKYSLPGNLFPEYSNATFSSLPKDEQWVTQSLENIGADFHLWSECPPLCEEAWKPISQLSPSLPLLESPNPIVDDQHYLLVNNDDYCNLNEYFNDQTLSMVVAEGLSNRQHWNDINNYNETDVKVHINKVHNEGIKKAKDGFKMSKIEALQYEEIRKYFEMPISKAAKELNVGLTVLKKRCRELNIKRWPHRKIKSLKALIDNVKQLGMMEEMAEVLEEHRRMLHLLPEMELTAETKRLRQACFKANYKKRRALALLPH